MQRNAWINTISTLVYSELRKGIKPNLYALSTIMFAAVLVLLIIMNLPKRKDNEITKKENKNKRQENFT